MGNKNNSTQVTDLQAASNQEE